MTESTASVATFDVNVAILNLENDPDMKPLFTQKVLKIEPYRELFAWMGSVVPQDLLNAPVSFETITKTKCRILRAFDVPQLQQLRSLCVSPLGISMQEDYALCQEDYSKAFSDMKRQADAYERLITREESDPNPGEDSHRMIQRIMDTYEPDWTPEILEQIRFGVLTIARLMEQDATFFLFDDTPDVELDRLEEELIHLVEGSNESSTDTEPVK